jgi:hypothetical protein
VGDADAEAVERVFNRGVAMTPLASSPAQQLDGVCKSFPRFHTNAPEMIHGIHHAFLVLGGLTALSAIVFRELKKGDGDTVSLTRSQNMLGDESTQAPSWRTGTDLWEWGKHPIDIAKFTRVLLSQFYEQP